MRLLAPFTPFVAEVLHERLVRSQGQGAPSVHLEDWPTQRGWTDQLAAVGFGSLGLLSAMAVAQRVVGLGRAARASHNLKTRQPLAGATMVFAPEATGADLRAHVERVRDLVLDELNVKEIRWAERRGEFVHHEVRPNFRVVGKRVGKLMPAVKAALEAADGDQLAEALERDGRITVQVEGESLELTAAEVEVRLIEKEGLATAGDRELLVALDTELTADLVAEGWAREVVNRLQSARKEAELDYADRIRVRYRADVELERAIATYRAWISGEALVVSWDEAAAHEELRTTDVEGHSLAFSIAKH